MKVDKFEYPSLCESEAERRFLSDLRRSLDTETTVHQQYKVAGYRLDFMLERGPTKLGIEVDALAYHQDWEKDARRDATILGSGEVSRILRIPAAQVFQNAKHVTYSIAVKYPDLFCRRSVRRLAGQIQELRGTEEAMLLAHQSYCNYSP